MKIFAERNGYGMNLPAGVTPANGDGGAGAIAGQWAGPIPWREGWVEHRKTIDAALAKEFVAKLPRGELLMLDYFEDGFPPKSCTEMRKVLEPARARGIETCVFGYPGLDVARNNSVHRSIGRYITRLAAAFYLNTPGDHLTSEELHTCVAVLSRQQTLSERTGKPATLVVCPYCNDGNWEPPYTPAGGKVLESLTIARAFGADAYVWTFNNADAYARGELEKYRDLTTR